MSAQTISQATDGVRIWTSAGASLRPQRDEQLGEQAHLEGSTSSSEGTWLGMSRKLAGVASWTSLEGVLLRVGIGRAVGRNMAECRTPAAF